MPNAKLKLDRFIKDCARRYGGDAAQATQAGLFILLGETAIHANLDEDAGRAAFWVDFGWPAPHEIEAAERAAADYMSERYLETGLILGVDRDAEFMALGASYEDDILERQDAFEIIEELAREAPSAWARLERAWRPAADYDEINFALAPIAP